MGIQKNQIDYTLVNRRWRTSVSATRTLPGADCGSDHEMLMCEFKFRLKCFKKSPKPIRYDLQEILLNFFYKIEIKSRFRALLDTAEEMEPNEMALESYKFIRRQLLIIYRRKKSPKKQLRQLKKKQQNRKTVIAQLNTERHKNM